MSDRDRLTNGEVGGRYEELRAQATGGNRCLFTPRGLALFLRAGMVAWIRAWSEPTPLGAGSTRATLARTRTLTAGARSEIAMVVACMALSVWKGGSDS